MESVEFLEENEINKDIYKKCRNMVNYICKYKIFSPDCVKLLESCEKFKNIKIQNQNFYSDFRHINF